MGIYVIRVPDIGEGIAEVELVAWHVALGESVKEDQPVADVMTDKASVEIPCHVHGKVIALGAAVGQMISVGAELIRLEVEGEGNLKDDAAPAQATAPAAGQAGNQAMAAGFAYMYYNQHLNTNWNNVFGFHEMNQAIDYEMSGHYETANNVINTFCFHTMQKFHNKKHDKWVVTNLNTGHFGENGIYEGVKQIRCGYLSYFKEMNYQQAMAMGGLVL